MFYVNDCVFVLNNKIVVPVKIYRKRIFDSFIKQTHNF